MQEEARADSYRHAVQPPKSEPIGKKNKKKKKKDDLEDLKQELEMVNRLYSVIS